MVRHGMLLTQEQIDTYTASGHWKNRLLTDYLDDAVTARPDQVAAVDSAGQLTYAQLAEQVEIAAHALHAAQVGPGDVIGIQLPNWHEWLVAHLAAIRVGAVTNPLIPIYRDREIGFMAEKAEVKVLFVPGDFRNYDYVAMVERLREQLGGFPGCRRAAARSGPEDFTEPRLSPNEMALIMFTSGTTGSAKGVMHTQKLVLAAALPWPDKLGMDRTPVVYMASIFGHLTGYLLASAYPLCWAAPACSRTFGAPMNSPA